jgi:hypothetical protein
MTHLHRGMLYFSTFVGVFCLIGVGFQLAAGRIAFAAGPAVTIAALLLAMRTYSRIRRDDPSQSRD